MSKICVNSEINTLKKVIIHTPGRELELMTPDTAEEVLYDDILNLENAREQHAQLSGVLQKVSQPLEVNDLLIDILKDSKVHDELIKTICMKRIFKTVTLVTPPDSMRPRRTGRTEASGSRAWT